MEQAIFQQFVQVGLGLISFLVSFLLYQIWRWIDVHTKDKRLELIKAFVNDAVTWAEQSGVIGDIEATGEAKKQAVIEKVQAFGDAHGWKINVGDIEVLIEAAVMNGYNRSIHSYSGSLTSSATSANSSTTIITETPIVNTNSVG